MKSKTVLLTSMGVLLIGFLLPESLTMPRGRRKSIKLQHRFFLVLSLGKIDHS